MLTLSNQLHDFNVGMGPDVGTVPGGNNFGTRVFWTAAVPDGDVRLDPRTGTVQLRVHNLTALDYPEDFASGSLGPNWQTGYVGAKVSFDIDWSRSINRLVTVRDATDQFAGTFVENHDATVSWSAQSASGFRFQSFAGNLGTSTPGSPDFTTTYFWAELGFEQNGIFFPPGFSGSLGAAVSSDAALVQAASLLGPHEGGAVPPLSSWAPDRPMSSTHSVGDGMLVAGLPPVDGASPIAPSGPLAFGGAAISRLTDQVFAGLFESALSAAV